MSVGGVRDPPPGAGRRPEHHDRQPGCARPDGAHRPGRRSRRRVQALTSTLCDHDADCKRSAPNLESVVEDGVLERRSVAPKVGRKRQDPDDPSAPAGCRCCFDGPRIADALATALEDPSTYPFDPGGDHCSTEPATKVTAGEVRPQRLPHVPCRRRTVGNARVVHLFRTTSIPRRRAVVALEASTLPQFTRAWTVALERLVQGLEGARRLRRAVGGRGEPRAGAAVSRRSDGRRQPELAAPGRAWSLARRRRSSSRPSGSVLLVGGPPCLSALRRDFLAHPTAKLDTASCEKKSPPIDFVAPG